MKKKQPKTEILYGVNPVAEALKAGKRRFYTLMVSAKENYSPRIADILAQAESLSIPVADISDTRLSALTNSESHQGIGLEASPLPLLPLDALLNISGKESPFFLVLDSIEDPHNLGALIRTALCSGVHGIILPKDRAASPTPTVSKASAGAMEHARMAVVTNLAKSMSQLKKEGLWFAGLDAQAPQSVFDSDLSGPMGIVIGGEDKGIRPLVGKNCDFMMAIPQKGAFNSLNASVAGAIVMYEAFRQRMGAY